MQGFAAVPEAPRYRLANATLPATLVAARGLAGADDGLLGADIVIAEGRVERLEPPGASTQLPRLDLEGGMVWPCFADMHTHIDKGHIWPRKRNADGTFMSALMAVCEDREARWSPEDVRRRMEFSLRSAYAHGTSLLRTHIDSTAPQHLISWPVFYEMRERWAGRIDVQGVALCSIEEFLDERFAGDLAALVRQHGGLLGAATYMIPELDVALERMFRLAADHGFDLDFHVDESADPAARSLRHIAEMALKFRFPGKIVAGHTCSLAIQPAAEAAETLARIAEAGIAAVSLPMCNLYLQDRAPGRTPRWRGVTLLHEMRALGIQLAVASDNTRDPFYPYGDLDMLEVFREAVRILHLDHPIGSWADIVAASPAAIMGRPDHGMIEAGRPADLVLFRARSWTELLARPQSDRTVLRAGRPIERSLPDYRELDDLMGAA